WDGGIMLGNFGSRDYPVNKVTGQGWDDQHGAYLTFDSTSAGGTAQNTYFTNLTVIHWRGEMFKSIDGNTNGHIHIHNCTYTDGNATALNIYGTWDVSTNYFNNLFQLLEYNQPYSSGQTNYFTLNNITNLSANGISFNGGSIKASRT